MTIQSILVPVDYSSCSRAALKLAAELAQRFQASLDVVHVWDRPSYVSDVVMTRSEPISSKSLIHLIQENAQRDLDEFLSATPLPVGTTISGRLLPGDPASALLHELKQKKFDLVVVGTHGRTGLAHALMGSVAEKLVRLSPVPVLTVPDEAARVQATNEVSP
jgi:universal stress protein A